MTRDPEFRKEVEKLDLDLDPVSGEEVQKIVRAIVATPADIVQKVQAATALHQDGPKAPGGGGSAGGGE
jgi:hypothetical protein